MSITAMKQALEAFEAYQYNGSVQLFDEAVTSLRQAIEQAEKQGHAGQLAKKGWQYFECPACGSEGAKGFPKPVQEPVAWVNWCAATGKRSVSFEFESELASQPLYATPPSANREWVGLTDEEIAEAVGSPLDGVYLNDFRKVIDKLKEKNNGQR